MTGKKFGLKQDDELSLKIEPEVENEIKEFPKINKLIKIEFNGIIFGYFYPSVKGIAYGKFKKIFNLYDYYKSSNNSDVENINTHCDYSFGSNNNIIGGGIYDGLQFIDPSNSSIKQLNLSKNAPKWRIISEGLNIFGICYNKDCLAYKKEVIKIVFLNGGIIFDMIKRANEIKCPICNKIITPNTCGFYKCEYQFIGEKLEDGEQIHYDSKTREADGNSVEYYQPKKGKEAKWFKLKIYVLPIQDIKYKPN